MEEDAVDSDEMGLWTEPAREHIIETTGRDARDAPETDSFTES